jgi:hypothetical protein
MELITSIRCQEQSPATAGERDLVRGLRLNPAGNVCDPDKDASACTRPHSRRCISRDDGVGYVRVKPYDRDGDGGRFTMKLSHGYQQVLVVRCQDLPHPRAS